MFSYFKKSKRSKDSQAIQGLLEIFYSPPIAPGLDLIPLESIDDDTRTKVLLFSYGVYDAYCQAKRLSNEEALRIPSELDNFFQNALDASFSGFLKTDAYRSAFDDPYLLKIIELGGQTYGDFASGNTERGGQSIIRLRSLVDIWARDNENKNLPSESQLNLTKIREIATNSLDMAWKNGFENVRNEMRVDDRRYGKSKTLDEIYDKRSDYNHTLDIIIKLAKLNMVKEYKQESLEKLTIEMSEEDIPEEKRANAVSYLLIAQEIKDLLLSGLFHKGPGALDDVGDKLEQLRFDVMSRLEKLGKFDADYIEDDYAKLLEDIKSTNVKPMNKTSIEEIRGLFDQDKGSK